MKVIYKDKKTSDIIYIYRCDLCSNYIEHIDESKYNKIGSLSERELRICKKCRKEIMNKSS
jgi:predicted SprT family Zn-dependent metalloprotease